MIDRSLLFAMVLSAVDRFSGPVQKAIGDVERLSRSAKAMGERLRSAGEKMTLCRVS